MKNTFVLRTDYADTFAEMSDKQAGNLIKAIFSYIATGEQPDCLGDVEVKMAFRFIKKDLDYNEERYQAKVEHNRKIARLGGAPSGNQNAKKQPTGLKNNPEKATGCKTTLNDDDSDVDNDIKNDSDYIYSADKAAFEKIIKKFARAVIKYFESEITTDAEADVWYRRNYKHLKDILEFCHLDIDLALNTIYVCAKEMHDIGYKSAGYKAVCSCLPAYRKEAKKLLEAQNGISYATARAAAPAN